MLPSIEGRQSHGERYAHADRAAEGAGVRGLAEIEATTSVYDILVRNLPAGSPSLDRKAYGMTRADWKREWASF